MDINWVHAAVAFGAGLVVGWNFFPQPQMVKDIVDKVLGIFG